MNDRKPAAQMESREPKSIRFTPSEWTEIASAASEEGIEASRFARQCCIAGLTMHRAQQSMRGHRRATA